MAKRSEKTKLSLRLLIDEEKNKVVLAESSKDFVDVLFSFLKIPMGTIVRLLEKHRKSPQTVVGCFNNLYKRVSEMGLESFQTESCKQMLLYPRSVSHDKYRKIKLRVDETEAVKYFVCQGIDCRDCNRNYYSISNTEKCECGRFMSREVLFHEEDIVQGRVLRNDNDGVFVRCKNSSFIITDDLKVVSSSLDYVLNTLRGLGYENANKLGEILLDVGISEVLTLLECLFTSNSPLTDTFLRKQSSMCLTRSLAMLTPTVQESGAGPGQTITLKAFVRKLDSKILCVECGADFIDLLFTFLALPLEPVWEITGDNISLGCIGNLFRSFKSLNKGSDASSSSKTLLPSYYSCPKQLLDVTIEQREIYYRLYSSSRFNISYRKFTRKKPDFLNCQGENILNKSSLHGKADARVFDMESFGFMREYTSFLVTNDLVIKPKDSVSNISLLKLKMYLEEEDVKKQVITIGKPEAVSLLRASMMTSSALTTCFWNLISKKAKEET